MTPVIMVMTNKDKLVSNYHLFLERGREDLLRNKKTCKDIEPAETQKELLEQNIDEFYNTQDIQMEETEGV